MKDRINVTQTFLPPIKEYESYLDKIWKAKQLTNNGPLLKEFEYNLKEKLAINSYNFHFVTNGTIALQIALNALDIMDGEVITTPFSYVATTSSILWERCTPVFVDIDPNTLNIDPLKIESLITDKTKAIMPVHVFGNPCDIEAIQNIATKHGLKVIYDAAHAFGVTYKGKSIFEYGDISICSFHATKLFHTIEGGGLFVKDPVVSKKVELIKRFGHQGDDHMMLGINAKPSEFQAAMGLCNLNYIDQVIENRKGVTGSYNKMLEDKITKPTLNIGLDDEYNYAYYPAIFSSEKELLSAVNKLNKKNIFPRRYFYPSLNTLSYLNKTNPCPISEDIAKRILCIPLFDSLNIEKVKEIAGILIR